MKVAIFVGGMGSRIKNFSKSPKPLIKINKKPFLKFILDVYKKNNINDFYLLCRKSNIRHFYNFHKKYKKNYNIKVINSGEKSNTGKRLLYFKRYLKKNEDFLLTYGDSISSFNLNKNMKIHKKSKNLITMSLFYKKNSYGEILLKKNKVIDFKEKKGGSFINAGFFIINEKIIRYSKKNLSFEKDIIPNLVKKNSVGFVKVNEWQPMDNKYDYNKMLDHLKNAKAKY